MSLELCFYVWLLKRDKMIYNNIGLVPFTYNKFFRHSCDPELMEDIIQIGYFGLINAVDNFDESRNVKFSAFACTAIRQCMVRGIENLTFALGTRKKKEMVVLGKPLCFLFLILIHKIKTDIMLILLKLIIIKTKILN